MALYRHNASGFLQEWASNPGAGYTAITAQPTDTVANRVAWWRTLDAFGQSSAWHPSENRTAQDPREAQLSLVFSSDGALIAADPLGNVTDAYLGGATTVKVFRGTTDVTISEGWTLSKTESGCTSTLTQSGGVYTLAITNIPTLATTTGYVRITATLTGSTTQTRDFRFLKVFAGQPGSSGNVLDLTNDAHTVPTDADGNNGNFAGCATTASMYVGSSDDSATWTWSVTKTNVTCTEATNSRTQTVTAMSADVGYVDFSASKSGQPTQVARFTVTKSRTGVSSTIYLIDPSIAAVGKSVSGAYNPASVTFSAFSITGASARTAYSGRFIIATQATVGGAWTDQYTSSADESSKAYTVPSSIVGIRCRLHKAGGTSVLVDEQAIPIVSDGATGSPAVTLEARASAYAVSVSKAGVLSPDTIDLTAVYSNISGTTTWTYQAPDANGGAWSGAWQTGDAYTWTVAMPVTRPWIKFKASRGGAEDVITVVRLEEGSDAVVAVISNDAVTLPSTSGGTVTSYAGSGTTISVFEGSTALEYDGSGTASGTWKAVATPSNIATGSFTDSGSFLTVGNHSGFAVGQDAASVSFAITGKKTNGAAFSLTRVQSISKAKAGADGGDGLPAIAMALTNAAHTVPTASDGTGGNFSGCACTASIYEGSSDTSATWTWSVTKTNVICTEATNSRTQTVTALNADVGYVDFTATKSGQPTQTGRFTITKAKAGVDGLHGTRTAILDVYRWSASAPSTFPVGTSTYTWATAQFTAPGTLNGWSLTPPAAVTGQTLWIARQLYADSNTGATSTVTWSAATAIPVGGAGTDGSNGTRLAVLEMYRWSATTPSTFPSGSSTYTWANGSFTAPSTLNGWSLTPGAAVPGQTLYGCTQTYSDNATTATSSVSWSTSTAYPVGAAGADAVRYWLDPSVSAVAKSEAGAYNPSALTVTAYTATGSAARSAYAGRFIIATQSAVGGAWTDRYTSGSDQSSYAYTVIAGIVSIRARLYQAGGTATLLDEEIIPIVSDGPTGPTGPGGLRGSRQMVVAGTSWSDSAAWAGVVAQSGTNPVLSDLVTIADVPTSFSVSKFYAGGGDGVTTWGTWTTPTAYINGNLLVTGTVGSNALASASVTTDKLLVGSVTGEKMAAGQGRNVIYNAGPMLGNEVDGWAVANNTTGLNWGVPLAGYDVWRPTGAASVFITATGTPSAGTSVDLQSGTLYPVAAGTKYEASALLSCHRVNAQIILRFYSAAGALISTVTGGLVTTQQASGALANWPVASVITTAPANAATVRFGVKSTMLGTAGPYLFMARLFLAEAGSQQTELSPWSPGGVITQIDGNGIKTGTLRADRFETGTLTSASGVFGGISANDIITGTLTSQTITVNGGAIKSSNFVSGSSGWQISGSGAAEFQNVTVRGTLHSATTYSGTWTSSNIPNLSADKILTGTLTSQIITVNGGAIKSSNFVSGSSGWQIDGSGNADFNTVMVRTKNVANNSITKAGGYSNAYQNTTIVSGNTYTFWTPNQPAVTYGRTTLIFSGVMVLANPSYASQAASAVLTGYKNGIMQSQQGIHMPSTLQRISIPFALIDNNATDAATTYSMTITVNAGSPNLVVEALTEWWLDCKR